MTDWEALARPWLRGLERYDPGQTRDALKAEHGLEELEPLNWNEDLFGPPARRARGRRGGAVERARFYPERAFADFRDAVAEWLGVPPPMRDPGPRRAGADRHDRGRFRRSRHARRRADADLRPVRQVCAAVGASVTPVVPARGLAIDLEAVAAAARDERARIVWLCDPNNPTGDADRARPLGGVPGPAAGRLRRRRRRGVHRLRRPGLASRPAGRRARDGRPVIVLRSFSKIFGLAGLRLGYARRRPARRPPARHRAGAVQRQPHRACRRPGRGPVPRLRRAPPRRGRRGARGAGRRSSRAPGSQLPSQANFVLVELGRDDGPCARRCCAAAC